MNQIAAILKRLDDHERQLKAATGGVQLKWSSIEDGALTSYDSEGELRLVIGQQDDGTQTIQNLNGPTPPTPSTPTATVDGPVITVTWDGALADTTAAIPADYRRVHVYLSDALGIFPTAPAGTIEPTAGATALLTVNKTGTYKIALAIESESGKLSAWSATVEVVVNLVDLSGAIDAVQASANGKNKITFSTEDPPIAYVGAVGDTWFKNVALVGPNAGMSIVGQWRWDGAAWVPQVMAESVLAKVDIGTGTYGELDGLRLKAKSVTTDVLAAGAVTASVLDGDAVNGKTITGATVRTSATGARVQLDSSGLRQWDANNNVVASMQAGSLNVAGNIATALPGTRRIEMRNNIWEQGAGMVFLPDGEATSQSAAMYQTRIGSPWQGRLELSTSETSNGVRNQIALDSWGVEIGSRTLKSFAEDGPYGAMRFNTKHPDVNQRGMYVGVGVQNEAGNGNDIVHSYLVLAPPEATNHWSGAVADGAILKGNNGLKLACSSGGTSITLDSRITMSNSYANMGQFTYTGPAESWNMWFHKGTDRHGAIGSPSRIPSGSFGIAADGTHDLTIAARTTASLTLKGTGDPNAELTAAGWRWAGIQAGSGTAMNVTAGGWIQKNSSARKYKILERPLTVDYPDLTDRLLSLVAKTWFDRASADRWAEIEDLKAKYGDDFDRDKAGFIPDALVRYPGLVAEDLIEAGLNLFVIFGPDGEPESIHYDRLAAALIPVLQQVVAEVKELRSLVTSQGDRIDALGARVTALEAA